MTERELQIRAKYLGITVEEYLDFEKRVARDLGITVEELRARAKDCRGNRFCSHFGELDRLDPVTHEVVQPAIDISKFEEKEEG